jgi:hypothetical protein
MQDDDFMMHDSVSPEVSTQYAMGEHGGPDLNDLHFFFFFFLLEELMTPHN